MAFQDFYRGKTALVTGHTGFKGSWASIWLTDLGARVIGYSLEPPSQPSNFEAAGLASRIEHIHGDVRDREHLDRVCRQYRPDVVFHLAAQAIVLTGFREPADTFSTNVIGTVNVCDVVQRHPSVKALVSITSDKCYENQEWVWGYRETDRLGGHDPYGASKACAELAIAVFQDARFRQRAGRPATPISSVRAGNVIGGGDWAASRLIPDIVRAIAAGDVIHLRAPAATRPWQHVLEAVSGYLWLAVKMVDDGVRYQSAYNFGPSLSARGVPVAEIASAVLGKWGPTSSKIVTGIDHSGAESGLLRLDVSRAEAELDWRTTWSVEETVEKTASWYRAYYSNPQPDMYDYSVQQVREYVALAKERQLAWSAS
jgi:CDP-glucose 4,6-dehydratase